MEFDECYRDRIVEPTLDFAFELKYLFGAVVGLLIGTLAGITGMPLGALRLPAVYSIVPTPHIAAGTNLGIDTVTATVASLRYWKEGLVDITKLVFMGSFSCIGSFLGGYLSIFVSYKWLLIVIGIVYFFVGIEMLLSAGSEGARDDAVSHPGRHRGGVPGDEHGRELSSGKIDRRGAVIAALWGFSLGFVGGMAGLLMGSLRVPVMIKAMGLLPVVASGTNMSISSFTAISGFLGHLTHGNIDLPVLLTMGAASMTGSYMGSRLGVTLSPTAARRLIGMSITVMAAALFINGIRK